MNTHKKLIELKSCPFCGGTRIRTTHIRDGRACGCGDCGAELHAFNPNAEAKAIELWNTRAAMDENP